MLDYEMAYSRAVADIENIIENKLSEAEEELSFNLEDVQTPESTLDAWDY